MAIAVALVGLVGSVVAVAVSLWSVRHARRGDARHERERLDDAMPRVRMFGPEPRRERWAPPSQAGGQLGDVLPDREFILPRQADDRILIGADVLLVNEGTTSALLQVDSPNSAFNEGLGPFSAWFGPGENASVPYREADGRYAMPPGAKCLLLVRAGHTVGEWVRSPAAPVRVEITVSSAGEEAVADLWVVELVGQVLDPVHQDASHWRVVPHTPVAATKERTRRYG